MIDWTQPIETTETPPRPVRVLFDSDGGVYGVDIETNLWGICSDRASVCRRDDNGMGTHFITLRNVAPPKPEPVLREAFLHLYADGGVAVTYVRTSAAPAVEVRHEKWMSDGSPVPGEDDYVGMMGRIAMLEQQRDSLKAEVERLNKANLRILGEIGQMRSVVDAAVEFIPPSAGHDEFISLQEAVRTYQNTPKKIAEEDATNVTPMMAPHKTCSNCRHNKKGGICAVEGPFEFDENGDCQDWEEEND